MAAGGSRRSYEDDFEEYRARSYSGGFLSSSVHLLKHKDGSKSKMARLSRHSNKSNDTMFNGTKTISRYGQMWKNAARRLKGKSRSLTRQPTVSLPTVSKSSSSQSRRCQSDGSDRNTGRHPKIRQRVSSEPSAYVTSRTCDQPNQSEARTQSPRDITSSPNKMADDRVSPNRRCRSYHGGSPKSRRDVKLDQYDILGMKSDSTRRRFIGVNSLTVSRANDSPEDATDVQLLPSFTVGRTGLKFEGYSYVEKPLQRTNSHQLKPPERRDRGRPRSCSVANALEGRDELPSSMLKRGSSLKGWSPHRSFIKRFQNFARSNSIPRRQRSMRQGPGGRGGPGEQASPRETHVHHIWVIGSSGIGKSDVLSRFLHPGATHTQDVQHEADIQTDSSTCRTPGGQSESDDEHLMDMGRKDKCDVSIVLDGQFSTLRFLEVEVEQIKREAVLARLRLVHTQPSAYLVLYSVEDRRSFQEAIECLYALRKGRWAVPPSTVIVLVANKIDLVRTRVVLEQEGRSAAKTYNGKYIEVSTAIDHNVNELLVGVLTLIRVEAGSSSRGSSAQPSPVHSYTGEVSPQRSPGGDRRLSIATFQMEGGAPRGCLVKARKFILGKLFGRGSAEKEGKERRGSNRTRSSSVTCENLWAV